MIFKSSQKSSEELDNFQTFVVILGGTVKKLSENIEDNFLLSKVPAYVPSFLLFLPTYVPA